jgi:hypothetical protein
MPQYSLPASSDPQTPDHPSDVSLLLRSHAERHWLSREVITVLREVETRDGLPEEQLGAALAYLEVIWLEAKLRARETDGAYDRLDGSPMGSNYEGLYKKALRYYSSVRVLREVVTRRVTPVLAGVAHQSTSPEHVDLRIARRRGASPRHVPSGPPGQAARRGEPMCGARQRCLFRPS